MSELKPATRRNFYVYDDVYRAMKRAARSAGLSVGAWLREAIAHYLRDSK